MSNCGDENLFAVTAETVACFTGEALELLEQAESALLQLDEQPADTVLIETVLRVFHSVKGNAGFMGYAEFEELCHRIEDIFVDIRDKQGQVNPELISVLLAVIDGLRLGIERLKLTGEAYVPGKVVLHSALDDLAGDVQAAETEPQPVRPAVGQPCDKLPEPAPAGESAVVAVEPGEQRVSHSNQQAIRVDVEKLDSLLDLIGELVVAEAMVSHNPDLKGLQLDRFDKASRRLGKIIHSIQDMAMSLRMIPLTGTFNKMLRLVRDVALKQQKKVELEIIGDETEVDKTIIEQISDPLVHLIRNAVDHGIESPEERIAVGKTETGKVTLEAKHAAGEVLIIIKDDGKGLDRSKILTKAREKGLIKNEGRELKDEEVWQLIFEPGLSTAAKVTDISGRGVGMDVVRRNIEKLRGRVDIRSSPGLGTACAIHIPLTLAIIEGMIVRVGTACYTIPIVSIRQSFQPQAEQVTLTPDGDEVVNVRGELLPVIRLRELYSVGTGCQTLTEGILIIVEAEAQKCCLFVDELVGQQQIVIKGLPQYLSHLRGVSGFAILGDGEVSMILDIASLVKSVEGTIAEVRL